MATRKHTGFIVPPEVVMELLRGNERMHSERIPEDAKLIDIKYDVERDCVRVIIETNSARESNSGELVRIDGMSYRMR